MSLSIPASEFVLSRAKRVAFLVIFTRNVSLFVMMDRRELENIFELNRSASGPSLTRIAKLVLDAANDSVDTSAAVSTTKVSPRFVRVIS